MNEKTEVLLRELAEKFGTTTEYLWEILVRQAPISGTIGIISHIAIVCALLFFFFFLPRSGIKETDECLYALLWVAGACAAIIFSVGILCDLPSHIIAIVNPEYWALKQILSGK